MFSHALCMHSFKFQVVRWYALTVRMKLAALFTDTASAVELHRCMALAKLVSITPLLPSIRHSIAPRSSTNNCTRVRDIHTCMEQRSYPCLDYVQNAHYI